MSFWKNFGVFAVCFVGTIAGIFGILAFGIWAFNIPTITERGPVHMVAYQILNVDPPKHVWADLREVETGKLHARVPVGKHCNRYKEIVIGSAIDLPTQKLTFTDGSVKWSIEGRAICPGN
jgi:hypothetical protein